MAIYGGFFTKNVNVYVLIGWSCWMIGCPEPSTSRKLWHWLSLSGYTSEISQTLHGGKFHWALYFCTRFGELDLLARSQRCQTTKSGSCVSSLSVQDLVFACIRLVRYKVLHRREWSSMQVLIKGSSNFAWLLHTYMVFTCSAFVVDVVHALLPNLKVTVTLESHGDPGAKCLRNEKNKAFRNKEWSLLGYLLVEVLLILC